MSEFVHEGIRYRELGDGNVEVIGPVAAPPQSQVFSLPPNPKEVREQADREADNARADASLSIQRANADRQAESSSIANELKRAELDLKRRQAGQGKPLPDGAAKRYEQAISAFADLDRVVGTFQDDYAGNFFGGLENTAQSLTGAIGTPGQAQWWSDLATTDNLIRNALFGASLTSGEQAAFERTTVNPKMAPSEVKANLKRRVELARGVLKRRTDFLKANGFNAEAIDALAGEFGPLINEPGQANQRADREDDPEALAAADFSDPNDTPPDNSPAGFPPANDPGGEAAQLTAATGDTREIIDEKMNATVNSLMQAGAAKAMIDAALKENNYPPLDYRQYEAARKWVKENPGKQFRGADVREVRPTTLMERLSGSAFGSGLANYADAATAGISTAMAGERGRGALDAMGMVNPNASAVGKVLGGVTGAGATELAALGTLGRYGARAAGWAPRVGDAAYGATQGLNSAEEGEGLRGAGLGAVSAVAGGKAGEWAMRGLGAATRGVRDPAVQALHAANVPMTVGQTVGNSGWGGAAVKKIEDALTGTPLAGNMVEARQREALRAWNEGAFQRGGAPGSQITETGAGGLRQVEQSKDDAYDATFAGVQIDPTEPQLNADILGAVTNAQTLPDLGPDFPQQSAMTALQHRLDGAIDPTTGQISGRGFQEAYRGLGRTARIWDPQTKDYADEVRGVTRAGQDALGEALERQNPGAFQRFIEANATNRRLNILADAVDKAKNQPDELFTPAQLNRADAQSASRLEGKISSATGNRPFYDWAQAGQSVLPSKVPDSGTWTRALVGGGLMGGLGGAGALAGGAEGAATGGGVGLGLALAAALGGTRGAQNVAVRALLDRPDVAITVGEELRRRAALGGTAGAGILAQIVAGQ